MLSLAFIDALLPFVHFDEISLINFMAALLFGNQMGTSLGNLPPSLWPPPEGGYPPLPFIDWG